MRHRLAIVLGFVLFLVGTLSAAAGAVPLHDPHQGTVADCEYGVVWHFVHNQTEATEGIITVGNQQVANGEPFEARVLHYWVHTSSNVLPDGVYDNVEDGKLVLSHYDCKPEETTTTTVPVTTTTVPVTTTTTPVTTTTTPVTTTTVPVTTTTTPVTTTTTPVTTTTTPETTTTVPETTTTTTPEKTTTTAAPECNEDSPSWNEEAQNCDPLPFTGERGLNYGGLGVAAIGILMMAYGVLGSDRKTIGVVSPA